MVGPKEEQIIIIAQLVSRTDLKKQTCFFRAGDSIKIGQVKLSLTSVEGIIKQMTKGDQFNGKQESKAVQ